MTFKTQSEYFSEMLAMLRAATGEAVSAESEPALRLKALASELELLGAEGAWIFRQSFPQTASGECLDRHAELRGISRSAAVAASGVVRFYTDGAAARTVDAGTVLLTADGSRFATAESITIPAGATFGDARAVAEDAGVAGNIPAGAITAMALAPLGVMWCENREAFAGGTDAESDESLRERLLASYKYLKGAANAAFYESEALSVDGVAAVDVLPRADGRGTVTVYVSSPEGVPSAELVAAVQAHLDSVREVSVDVTVLPAMPSDSTFRATIYYYPDEAESLDALKAACTAVLKRELINGFRMGGYLHNAKLVDALMNARGELKGLGFVRVTSPAESYELAAGVVPTIKSIAYTAVELTEAQR